MKLLPLVKIDLLDWKGNSFRGVLRIAKAAGLGGECASFPEAMHALSVGFAAHQVVFDSPCKTKVKAF